jgi:hypothetical protein
MSQLRPQPSQPHPRHIINPQINYKPIPHISSAFHTAPLPSTLRDEQEFMDDDSLVIRSITLGTPPTASDSGSSGITLEAFVRAGARAVIHVDPDTAVFGIMTCGGLCPGLNNIIHNIAQTLLSYNVPPSRILGIRNGTRGLLHPSPPPIPLTPQFIADIHRVGGSAIGSARGGHEQMPALLDGTHRFISTLNIFILLSINHLAQLISCL